MDKFEIRDYEKRRDILSLRIGDLIDLVKGFENIDVGDDEAVAEFVSAVGAVMFIEKATRVGVAAKDVIEVADYLLIEGIDDV